MRYHIRNRTSNGYIDHYVYKGDLFIGCYWQKKPGNWQVEMANGIGWDMIDTPNDALQLIKDNEICA